MDALTHIRLLTAETAPDSTYTDEILTGLLNSHEGDAYAVAYDVWTFKLAEYAGAYDFSADGGDYKRSQVYQHMQAEASRCYALSNLSGMVIDPTEKEAPHV